MLALPFDEFLPFGDVLGELLRMRASTAEERFIALFDRQWSTAFPSLMRLFPSVDSPATVRMHLRTLALS
ncbi:MAG: hypothetical protein SGPRY_004241 [Prymnesium sp.]